MAQGFVLKPLRLLALLSLVAGSVTWMPSAGGAAASEVERDRLSGATRYKTAVEIAEAYVEEVESDRFADDIDTVILVSGHDDHFAYAMPAPALARQYQAPILLTEPDELHSDAEDFIDDFDIASVIILGSTDIVSGAVEDAVDALGSIDVERIWGLDEYETAIEIADQVGTPGEFGASGRTLFLATGEAFADALAVGPVAYQGEHPIVLTPSDDIPDDVLDYIDGSRAEHVVILGGTAAVSSRIENDVEDLGVDVTRWSGASRVETAIEMAKALLAENPPHACFDGSEVGLAYAWNHPDAIVSGPYLGELCAPLLLTESRSLSDAVSSILSSVEYFKGDDRGRLRITAFGGTGVISNGTLRDAADAAELESVDATVTATQGNCYFDVTFSEPVSADDALNTANYTHIPHGESVDFGVGFVDDTEADNDLTTTSSVRVLLGGNQETGAVVPTGCNVSLKRNDTVGIAANAIYATDDIRSVRPTSALVRPDTQPPTVTIHAVSVKPISITVGSTTTLHVTPDEATAVLIEATEPITAASDGDISIEFAGTRSNSTVRGVLHKTVPAGSIRLTVTCVELATLDDPDSDTDITNFRDPTDPVPGPSLDTESCLVAGDTVTIKADQITDLAGNKPRRDFEVTVQTDARPRPPRASVSVTAPVSNQNASVYLEGQDESRVIQANALLISAKSGTAAGGAAGNGWSVELVAQRRRPSDWGPSQSAAADVSRSRRTISITTIDDATLSEIAKDLNAEPSFAGLFMAEVNAGDEDLNAAEPIRALILDGGSSSVDITVSWGGPVRDCAYAPDPSGVTDANRSSALKAFQDTRVHPGAIEIDLDGDGLRTFDLENGTVDSTLGIEVTTACDTQTPGARAGTIVATVTATDFDGLPHSRSRANIPTQTAYDLRGIPNENQFLTRVSLVRSSG